jgi:hypothetical protein
MEIQNLLDEIKSLREENEKLKKQLEIYYNPQKEYYQKNKQIIKEKALQRLASLDKEKLKEYRRNAYLKRKEKKIGLEN